MPNTREKLIELISDAIDPKERLVLDGAIRRMADHLIANGVTVSEWISVKDRLPDTEVDRSDDEDGSSIAYEISDWLWGVDVKGMQARVRYESDPCFQGWYDEVGTTYNITHWMPLPEPPKEV